MLVGGIVLIQQLTGGNNVANTHQWHQLCSGNIATTLYCLNGPISYYDMMIVISMMRAVLCRLMSLPQDCKGVVGERKVLTS